MMWINMLPGCQVHGHDHTINLTQPKNEVKPNFFVWDLGIGNNNDGKLRTLKTLLENNGHLKKHINYLKVNLCSMSVC